MTALDRRGVIGREQEEGRALIDRLLTSLTGEEAIA